MCDVSYLLYNKYEDHSNLRNMRDNVFTETASQEASPFLRLRLYANRMDEIRTSYATKGRSGSSQLGEGKRGIL
jgi:hypothetical protein